MTCRRGGRAPGDRPRWRLSCLTVLAAATTLTSACGGGGQETPKRLVDGSLARSASIRFESVGEPVLMTRLRLVSARSARPGSRLGDCLGSGWSALPAWSIVHRLGTDGESATFLDHSRRALMACDGTRGDLGSAWCGHVHGRLVRGRLRDPRLGLGGCSTTEGQPVAFVWITPRPRARYVVVERRGFSESYEAAAGLPVRVAATERVDTAHSSALVRVSEHAVDGRRLRAYDVEARVAG